MDRLRMLCLLTISQAHCNYYAVNHKKGATFILTELCQLLTKVKNSSTVGKRMKFPTEITYEFLSHLKYVAALPCPWESYKAKFAANI